MQPIQKDLYDLKQKLASVIRDSIYEFEEKYPDYEVWLELERVDHGVGVKAIGVNAWVDPAKSPRINAPQYIPES